MNKEYCYNCDDFVNINIREEQQYINIKGCDINFLAKIAYCDCCNEKVYIFDLEDKIIEKGFFIL